MAALKLHGSSANVTGYVSRPFSILLIYSFYCFLLLERESLIFHSSPPLYLESLSNHDANHLIYLLADQQLGDCLGRGAFGQVYRGLNWTTGETVAVKQIQLGNIPKSELGEIMVSIHIIHRDTEREKELLW